MKELTVGLFQTQIYKTVAYSNLQLYGNEISEVVDRECLIRPTSVSTYWPGGLPYLGETGFGTFLLGQKANLTDYSKIAQIRETVLGLELSKRALKRWDDVIAERSKQSGYGQRPETDYYLPLACEVSGVPLSALVLSEVIRHRKIKAGQTVAHLYFPSAIVNPKLALNDLKVAQRVTIAEEQI